MSLHHKSQHHPDNAQFEITKHGELIIKKWWLKRTQLSSKFGFIACPGARANFICWEYFGLLLYLKCGRLI
jgi:hypothetical protein